MRFEEENSHSFGPVLRRIAILAVIITLVPAMLWTITSFMRTYVAQPVIPSARPMAFSDSSAVSPANAAPSSPGKPIVEARATATDADGKSDQSSDNTAAPVQTPPATTGSVTPALQYASPSGADTANSVAANSPWPDPAQAIGERRLQAANPAGDASDALAASTPLTGPIPLPPHRPKYLAMADNGAIPLPRRRPANIAAAAAEDAPPESGNFLTHLFGQTH